MTNIYKKNSKKGRGWEIWPLWPPDSNSWGDKSRKSKVQSRRGISEVGLPKIDVGLTKSYIKRVGVAGFVVVNVLSLVLAVWVVMPANGAEAAFSCATGTMN